MGRKKVAFIDKKAAQHFHVVHRSQRDKSTQESNYVLISSTKPGGVEYESSDGEEDDDEEMPDLFEKSADLVNELGMVNDGYDYNQHLKEITGAFYSAKSHDFVPSGAQQSSRVVLPEEALPGAEEQARRLDAITLTTDVMDEDMREALINDSAFEEMTDDFILQATSKDMDQQEEEAFDYEQHIQKLMLAASNIHPYHHEDEEEEEELSDLEEEVEPDQEEEMRLLNEKFEAVWTEYDDEQIGDLGETEAEIESRGNLKLEGVLLDEIVSDFVTLQQELNDDEGRLGNPLQQGNRLPQILAECERQRLMEEEELAESGEMEPKEEEEEMDELEGQRVFEEYLTYREKERWDAETIVSTYSNLDNHPTVISEPIVSKNKKKKKKTNLLLSKIAEGQEKTIELSRKTGMPLGVLPSKEKKTSSSKNKPPQSSQSNEEENVDPKQAKKERKRQVKLENKQRRMDKKNFKQAFKEEEQVMKQVNKHKQAQTAVSVFKY